MLATRAADASCGLVYVNQVGGQDELVFDGASMVFDADGKLLAAAAQFEEDVLVCDIEVRPGFRKRLLDPRGRTPTPPLPVVEVTGEPRPRDDENAVRLLCRVLADVRRRPEASADNCRRLRELPRRPLAQHLRRDHITTR